METNWFPLSVGNYWIYSDSVWKNESFLKVSIDTISVTEVYDYKGVTAYRLSNKTSFYNKGDSIYQI
ncbi:MAG: hypothetical protein JKY42_01835 [Flavobacteriales bacterium]|nr:hypothetical protein [Flavobacteriales bacterium]